MATSDHKTFLSTKEMQALRKVCGLYVPRIYAAPLQAQGNLLWANRFLLSLERKGTTRLDQDGYLILTSRELESPFGIYAEICVRHSMKPDPLKFSLAKPLSESGVSLIHPSYSFPISHIDILQAKKIVTQKKGAQKKLVWDHALIFHQKNGYAFAVWVPDFFGGELHFSDDKNKLRALARCYPQRLKVSRKKNDKN